MTSDPTLARIEAAWRHYRLMLGAPLLPEILRKVADTETGRRWLPQYLAEAEKLAAIRHMGLSSLLSGLTMEAWARGQLKQNKHPPEAAVRNMASALIGACSKLHDAGFLHLDIKPSTVIMLDPQRVAFGNLGSARRYPMTAASAGFSTHTPGFAAPEQHANDHGAMGPATDIYGIAASLLFVLTGRLPPAADARHHNDTLPGLLAAARQHYSPALIAAIEHCMSLSIGDRPSTLMTAAMLLGED
jgi:serine/threonine protein kinase